MKTKRTFKILIPVIASFISVANVVSCDNTASSDSKQEWVIVHGIKYPAFKGVVEFNLTDLNKPYDDGVFRSKHQLGYYKQSLLVIKQDHDLWPEDLPHASRLYMDAHNYKNVGASADELEMFVERLDDEGYPRLKPPYSGIWSYWKYINDKHYFYNLYDVYDYMIDIKKWDTDTYVDFNYK